MTNLPDSVVRDYIAAHRAAFLADLVAWLVIPSISGDPRHEQAVRNSAEWLAATLRETGFGVVEIWETAGGGLPAVFAEWPADDPGAPTVTVYGHHDVQPVEPLELWESPPFEPLLRAGPHGEQLFGRGTADDKGQLFFHTLGLRAHLAATGRTAPAVNLKIIVEGEEESGSPHFADLLTRHADRLACDVVVVSDTGMWSRDTPSITTAMRGLTTCQIDFRGPDVDLHSGSFGGAVPNPLHALVAVLADLHDDAGRVTLPGFYDRVVELTERERELFARLPFDSVDWLGTAGSRAEHGEKGFSTLERVWARPTAEINGAWGGHTGPGHKTVVPADAHAKVSFRLVADQDPGEVERQMRAWLAERVPEGIDWQVAFHGGGVRPCMTPLDHPALESVTRAMSRAFEQEILYTREGGSGPEADLAEILDAPVVFLGVGMPDDRIHAPNEKVEVELLLKGAEAAAYLWEDLAASYPARSAAVRAR
jgi:acetylornithine deacetylase/succinyl-diaminopimelate desuccinylase-like protein